MKVYGASVHDIETVVADVSRRAYDDNLIIRTSADQSNSRGARARFTLQVRDSSAHRPGAIGNPRHPGTGPHGMRRRALSACWHAHWDVIEELLRQFPQARVSSGLRLDGKGVTYRAATFRDLALRTAHLNIGSSYEPVTMPQCCECDHTRYTSAAPVAHDEQRVHSHQHATGYDRYDDDDNWISDDGHTAHQPAGPNANADPLAYRPWNGQLPHTILNDGNAFSPTPGADYPLDGLKPAAPWTPRVKPGSDTVGDTLSAIDDVLDES